MPLTELQAQQIALVRVLEQTRDNAGVWTGLAVALCALLAGFATDYLAAQPHIDIVERPLVLLIGWNLLVFAWGALAWLWRFIRRGSGSQGPLAGVLGAWWAA